MVVITTHTLICDHFVVGEKDEVSIKDVADGIVKAMNFQGEYAVSILEVKVFPAIRITKDDFCCAV